MHFLGIPTSRAGSIVTSDTLIERDIFYDGHPIMEKASVVARIAPTFIRFGSFEICKPSDLETGRAGPSVGNMDILKTLLQYVVQTFYPEIWNRHGEDDLKLCYLEFFTELVKRTAILIAKWQSVGFCHGVLNTDNMSIVGITIDYGPFGFMDRYDPNFICNASDTGGRYSFTNQPSVCKWNCTKLAEALKNIIPLNDSKEIIDKTYDESYKLEYFHRMFLKIGMTYSDEFEYLITDLLQAMYETGTDYTNTFLALERIIENISNNQDISLDFLLTQTATLDELKKAFKPTLSREDRAFFWRMANNERDRLISMGGQFILEDEEKQDKLEKIEKLSEQDQQKENISLWKKWIEKYKSALQQYWQTHNVDVKDSLIKMRNNNPRIVLRNYLADIAIKAAEKGDFSKANMLLERLERPFSEGDVFTSIKIDSTGANNIMYDRPPIWAHDLKVT